MDKIISYVYSDASLLQRDTFKMGRLLNKLNFLFYEPRKDLCADIFKNPDTKQEIALCMMSKERREDMYRQWIDKEEAVIPGLNLRFLYNEDFKDWVECRREWSKRS